MNDPTFWLTTAIVVLVIGSGFVSLIRDVQRAAQFGLAITGIALAAVVVTAFIFYREGAVHPRAFCMGIVIDELNTPRFLIVATLEFLTSLWTSRNKIPRFSSRRALIGAALRLALFASNTRWVMLGFLSLEMMLPLGEIRQRKSSPRIYVIYLTIMLGLIWSGHMVLNRAETDTNRHWGAALLLAGILVRCGVFPFHSWVPDLFRNCPFGASLLMLVPMTGTYVAMRTVLPIASDLTFQIGCGASLLTALYAAGLANVQTEVRRYYAYTLLSQSALLLVGMQLNSTQGLTAALCEGISVALAMGGFGLTLRALEARFETLDFQNFRGLYDQTPALAVCLLTTGLASVGFPGTLGFVSADLLVEGAIAANPFVGLIVVLVAALNGTALLRAYFLIFAGPPHASKVSLDLGPRERVTVLSLMGIILIGGLVPQPWVSHQRSAAESIIPPVAEEVRQERSDD